MPRVLRQHAACFAPPRSKKKGPPWLRGTGKGWVTAEYSMLPRATHERTRREVTSGKPSGPHAGDPAADRPSLRAVVNLPAIGERQIVLDCDVIQADGGTRTASITGAWVALHECFTWMQGRSIISINPLREPVAAVSCGIYKGKPVLDLDYAEDSRPRRMPISSSPVLAASSRSRARPKASPSPKTNS